MYQNSQYLERRNPWTEARACHSGEQHEDAIRSAHHKSQRRMLRLKHWEKARRWYVPPKTHRVPLCVSVKPEGNGCTLFARRKCGLVIVFEPILNEIIEFSYTLEIAGEFFRCKNYRFFALFTAMIKIA